MKIIEFQAENIKRLTVAQIRPDGNLVQITGANGSGKTSVLDSIMYALQGAATIPSAPIRRGAKSAKVRLDLGELIVTRKFSEAGSTLTVENASGLTHKTPQAVLDKLLGSIAFDPLAFSRQKPREQFDTLRSLVKLDIDLEAIDGANDRDYRERADLNKAAKQRRATLANMPTPPADLPAEKIDTSALVDEIAAAGQHNGGIEREKDRRTAAAIAVTDEQSKAQQCRDKAASYRRMADELDAAADHHDAKATAMQKAIDEAPAIPAFISIAEVRKKLTEAQRVNEQIDQRTAHRNLENEAAQIERDAAALTNRMAEREQSKREAIAAAKFPIAGISFGNNHVLLNGVPFEQASDAEQLRASCAIAMAANPTLRVLRIRDGSLLDENGLRLLAEMAEAQDYQCWIERVDSTGMVGIVMEDGHIKGVKVEAEHATI